MAKQISLAKAEARIIRIIPRKARLIIDPIRGKSIAEAPAISRFTPGAVSPVVGKVLKLVIVDAEYNYDLGSTNPYVSETHASEGTTLKGFRPRAKGMTSPTNKRADHVVVIVPEKNN